ncbi:MAG TPA: hypothetical protein VFK41_13385 [Nocardioidaceae bacterium]|nr:hypothetical protein [Nocardioidaceae bacterium]
MNVWKLVQAVKDWPVTSQQAARRNALVASTALTQLRIERAEIEAFVEAAAARHEVRANRAAAVKLA